MTARKGGRARKHGCEYFFNYASWLLTPLRQPFKLPTPSFDRLIPGLRSPAFSPIGSKAIVPDPTAPEIRLACTTDPLLRSDDLFREAAGNGPCRGSSDCCLTLRQERFSWGSSSRVSEARGRAGPRFVNELIPSPARVRAGCPDEPRDHGGGPPPGCGRIHIRAHIRKEKLVCD